MALDQRADALGHDEGAVEVRFGQDDDELLTAVAGEQFFLADAALDAGGDLAEGEIAAEVAEVVVDRLEAVDVEHHQRQRPAVAGRAGDLAVEELHHVALVVRVGQGVDDGEPIDLLVILRLDVAAGEVAIDAVADAQVVAVLQLADGGGHVVDEGAVGALQVDGVVAVRPRLNPSVAARDGVVVDADVTVVAATQDDRRVGQRVAGPHAGPGGVDVDHAGITTGRRYETVGPGDPGFRRFLRAFHHRQARGKGPGGPTWGIPAVVRNFDEILGQKRRTCQKNADA